MDKKIIAIDLVVIVCIVGALGYIAFQPATAGDTLYEYRVLVYDFSGGIYALSDIGENVELASVRVINTEPAFYESDIIEIFAMNSYEYNYNNAFMGEGNIQLRASHMHKWTIQVWLNTTANETLCYNMNLNQYQNRSMWQNMTGVVDGKAWQYSFTFHQSSSPYVVEVQLIEV